jgi:hypothetical protein
MDVSSAQAHPIALNAPVLLILINPSKDALLAMRPLMVASNVMFLMHVINAKLDIILLLQVNA